MWVVHSDGLMTAQFPAQMDGENQSDLLLVWRKTDFKNCTCCDGPDQWHQTHLDRTAPGPHDEHHPQRLTDHQTLVQRGELNQSHKLGMRWKQKLAEFQCTERKRHPPTLLLQKGQSNLGFNLLWWAQHNTGLCSGEMECSLEKKGCASRE